MTRHPLYPHVDAARDNLQQTVPSYKRGPWACVLDLCPNLMDEAPMVG